MNLLDPSEYPSLSPLLLASSYFIAPRAVLEGEYPGSVFVDNSDRPSMALVWLSNLRGYLFGSPHPRMEKDLLGLIYGYMYPLLKRATPPVKLELAAPNDRRWLQFLDNTLARLSPRVRYKLILKFDPAAWQKSRTSIPLIESHWACSLEERVHQADDLANHRDTRWKQSLALSMTLHERQTTRAHCEATGLLSNTDFLIWGRLCDLCLHEDFCGYQVADRLLQLLVEQNLTPWWTVREDNLPGQRLGAALGFTKVVSTFPIYSLTE